MSDAQPHVPSPHPAAPAEGVSAESPADERLAAEGVLEGAPPRFDEAGASRLARELFGVDGPATSLGSERDQNFRIDAQVGAWVLKIANAGEDPAVLAMENAAIAHVERVDPSMPVPRLRPTLDGAFVTSVRGEGDLRHLVRMVSHLSGDLRTSRELDDAALYGYGRTLARLGLAMRGFFDPAAGRVLLWDVQHAMQLMPLTAHIEDSERRALVRRALARFSERAAPLLGRLRAQVVHGDVTLDNTLFDEHGRVCGIFDFGDMSHTALVVDLASGLEATMMDRDDPFEAGAEVLRGYEEEVALEDRERAVLPLLLEARAATTLTLSAWRVRRFPDNAEYITGWDAGVWPLLELLDRMGPDDTGRRLMDAAAAVPVPAAAPTPDPVPAPEPAPIRRAGTADLAARRATVLGPALLPLSYSRPLHLVRGQGVWLYDVDGRAYLDAYNNVPVVGHAHPRVADAIARQARTLNTNTRYLYPEVIDLAERLVATMPDGIDTCMFVNSGSEANDLAWRLATAVTGARGGIVTDFAYHGVTSAIADLSPEEWGAAGRPPAVATFTVPGADPLDPADLAGAGAEAGAGRDGGSIDDAVRDLDARGHRPAAVYVDGGFTSDGIHLPAPAFLQEVQRRTAEAGALFVGDEVQAGYGRLGSHRWSFEAHGVAPDIVTLGKPMGNGHPVAALLTRRDLVERWSSTTSYFSTFGGNPVACAAASAVLDVCEEERLQQRAAEVGGYLADQLRELAARHEAIGEVRGRGLLLGVELVRDRSARAPASAEAEQVADELRERGVLVGITGRRGSTLKIRPPLVFERDHADLLVAVLDEVLAAVPFAMGRNAGT